MTIEPSVVIALIVVVGVIYCVERGRRIWFWWGSAGGGIERDRPDKK